MKGMSLVVLVVIVAAGAAASPPGDGVSAVSALELAGRSPSPFVRVSPLGTSRIELTPTGGEADVFEFTLSVSTHGGTLATIQRVRASDVLATDVGRIVAVEAPDTHVLPATIRILDLHGNELASRTVPALSNPTVSPDGSRIGYRSFGATRVLDLVTLEETASSEPWLPDLERGPAAAALRATTSPATRDDVRGIPWPFAPDAQHAIGNTYGEYQNYGGSPYLHPGIDVFGTPGQAVYAVRRGVVKAILTTSGYWHWRVAVGDTATAGTCKGYLYAHLQQSTIAVSVGQTVLQGQYLGSIVEWPNNDFHHCHFARIEDSGTQWDGSWLATENPHLHIANQSEDEPPAFEPARGTDLLAFAANQTSTYQSPGALHGKVDIIAHVGDTIESPWVCSVQEIRYTIYPLGYPAFPLVNGKLSVNFDMADDTYTGGPIDPFLVGLLYKQDATCQTQGDYDYREFYHIITNSNGDEVYDNSDLVEAWDTTLAPDADYVIRVVAKDAAGNATADSMAVHTANGNPASVPSTVGEVVFERTSQNPTSGGASLMLSLPSPEFVTLSVVDVSGRVVRKLHDGLLPAGLTTLLWDGRGAGGRAVASGVYFVRLETASEARTEKLAIVR